MKQELITAYSQLFEQHRDAIITASPTLLNKNRAEAFTALQERGLPQYREEDYQKFNIGELLSAERTLRLLTEGRGITFEASTDSDTYFLGTLADFEAKHPGIAEQYFNRTKYAQADRLTTLNTLFATEVIVFYVPKGVKLPETIRLVHHCNEVTTKEAELTFPRILWIAEEDSHSALALSDTAHDAPSTYIGVIEIFAEERAHLQYYNVERTNATTMRVMNTHVEQSEKSQVLIDDVTINNGRTRNNYYCALNGEEAHLDLDGLGILNQQQKLDNWSIMEHNVPNCHSDELFKYTLHDQAIGSFSGLIYVAPNAQKTLAYQNNRNLLLSDKAKMFSKPQLEIYADDVKCSHGMTTGEINEAALFYMQQRGIPYAEAKLMLTIAFMDDVLEKIEDEAIREKLYQEIEERYRTTHTMV